MSFFYNWYKNELPIVIKAWKSFILTAILFLSFGLGISIWHYSETINVKNDRIINLNDQLKATENIILNNIKSETSDFSRKYKKSINEIKENYEKDMVQQRLYWEKTLNNFFSSQVPQSYISIAKRHIKETDSLFDNLMIDNDLKLKQEIIEMHEIFKLSEETKKYLEKAIANAKEMK